MHSKHCHVDRYATQSVGLALRVKYVVYIATQCFKCPNYLLEKMCNYVLLTNLVMYFMSKILSIVVKAAVI